MKSVSPKLVLIFPLLFSILFSQDIQWRSLNEPGSGGRITDVGISPFNPKKILVSGDMLGLTYSEDGGKSWLPSYGFNSYELAAISFHPTDSQVVWVGSMSGPFKSEDGGLIWQSKRRGMDPIKRGSFSCPVEIILFDPFQPNRLLAFGGSKREWSSPGSPRWSVIWESTDDGENWSYLSTVGIEEKPGITAAAFIDRNKIAVAAAQQGLYLSSDNGQSWSKSENGLPTNPYVLHVTVNPQNKDILYTSIKHYLQSGNYMPGGVFKSVDGGQNWSNASNGLEQSANSNPNQASWYKTVKVAPSNSNVLYTANSGWTNSGVYKSMDAGSSWQAILNKSSTQNFPTAFFTAAGPELSVFDIGSADPNIFVGGSSTNVFATSNGGNTWTDLMSIPTNDPLYFKGNGFCGLVSRMVAFNPYDPSHIVLQSMDDGKFMHTKDELETWAWAGRGMSNYAGGRDVCFATADIIYCTTGQSNFDGVWKSTDQGQTWSKFGIADFPNANPNVFPNGIHCLPGSSNKVWVVLDDKLYRSRNGNGNWEVVLSAPGLNYISETSTPEHFFLNSAAGVYETLDGETFTLMPASPTKGNQLRVDPNDNGI
ncbi:MAG: hypothetical protein AAF696_31475, partial [Bacteroidota bacterium]